MDISQTLKLLNTFSSQTNKKSEKKVYACFIRTLSSLEKKDLTPDQLLLIHEKLSSLHLNTTTKNNKKYYKQRLSTFKGFLKNEFSFTSERYYTEIGMVFGMCLGSGIGMTIGVVVNPLVGTGIGLSIGIGVGMLLGMLYGTRKDTAAMSQGNVL
jgi:hypothetical protein